MIEKHVIRLTANERKELIAIVKTGKGSAKKILHARVLLEADISEGKEKTDTEIADLLYLDIATIRRIRKRCVEEGIESALNRRTHSMTRPLKFDGEKEAHLVALCCSKAPEGRQRWTMRLLADKAVQLEIVDSVAPATVWRALKKTNLSLGKKGSGVFRQK